VINNPFTVRTLVALPVTSLIGLTNGQFYDLGTDGVLRLVTAAGAYANATARPHPLSIWDASDECSSVSISVTAFNTVITGSAGFVMRNYMLYPPSIANYTTIGVGFDRPPADQTISAGINGPAGPVWTRLGVGGFTTFGSSGTAGFSRFLTVSLLATTYPSAGSGSLIFTLLTW